MTTMQMDPPWWPATIELRQRGGRIFGSFPFNVQAVVRASGTVRKERFRPGAFDFALDDPSREVSLLVGHDYGQPLASKLAGTLAIRSTPAALEFNAVLPPTSWAADLRAGIEAGAANYGVSPGFSLPPPDVVPGAETLTPEPGNPGVMVRTLNAVVLHEVSFVSRATYQGTEISLRHEDLRDDEAAAELVALQERRRLLYGLL